MFYTPIYGGMIILTPIYGGINFKLERYSSQQGGKYRKWLVITKYL
jgi:hypothetical protein